MFLDWARLTPWASLAGGVPLGVAAAVFVLVSGRMLRSSRLAAGQFRRGH